MRTNRNRAQESVENFSGRGFNNLMLNSVAVQNVLMDDVMEEMAAEGAGGTGTGHNLGESTGLEAEKLG